MPTSGTMGISFSEWQSQFGDMSMTRLIWKCGLSLITALLYSAIFLFKISLDSSPAATTESIGQIPIQRPHPTHLS